MSWCEDVKCQESAPPTISAEEAARHHPITLEKKLAHLKSRSFPWNDSTGCIRCNDTKTTFYWGCMRVFQDGVFQFLWNVVFFFEQPTRAMDCQNI